MAADRRWQDVITDIFPIDITHLEIKGGYDDGAAAHMEFLDSAKAVFTFTIDKNQYRYEYDITDTGTYSTDEQVND